MSLDALLIQIQSWLSGIDPGLAAVAGLAILIYRSGGIRFTAKPVLSERLEGIASSRLAELVSAGADEDEAYAFLVRVLRYAEEEVAEETE